MKNKKIIIISLLIIFGLLLSFNIVLAGSTFLQGIQGAGQQVSFFDTSKTDPLYYVANVLRFLLAFVGVTFIALIIYSGVTYMTSGGNEDKVKKATNTIKSTSAGLLLIIMGFSITTLIVRGYTTGGSGQLGEYDDPSDLFGSGYDNIAYDEGCEDYLSDRYYDIDCCKYRLIVFGTTTSECCSETVFAQELGNDCTKYCNESYCDGQEGLANKIEQANSICNQISGSIGNLVQWSNNCEAQTSTVLNSVEGISGRCKLNIDLNNVDLDDLPAGGVQCVWRN